AASTHGDEQGLEGPRVLPQDLEPDRPLAGDHVLVVERVHEGGPGLRLQAPGVAVGFVVALAHGHDLAAQALHGLDLDGRGGDGHDDDRPHAHPRRGHRHTLRVVAGRSADDPRRQLVLGEVGELVVGAAQLERVHALQVFPLERDPSPEALGQPRHGVERRLGRDVVHPCRQHPPHYLVHPQTLTATCQGRGGKRVRAQARVDRPPVVCASFTPTRVRCRPMEERLVPVIGRIAVPVAAFVVMLAACGGPGGAPGGGGGPRATVPIPTAQPLDVTVATDDSRATTQTVPTGGGTLKATAVDGTQYVLTIPSTALLAETTITMTPLSDVEGAPLAGTAHGVSLEPTGLRLYDFATLEIIPPAGSGTHVAGFGTQGQGRGF